MVRIHPSEPFMESCPRGLWALFGKQMVGQPAREFESPRFRQFVPVSARGRMERHSFPRQAFAGIVGRMAYSSPAERAILEWCSRGLWTRFAKPTVGKPARGFESLPLRHFYAPAMGFAPDAEWRGTGLLCRLLGVRIPPGAPFF